MAAVVVSGWRTMAPAALAPAADASTLTAVSFATEPGGRSRSDFGAAAAAGAASYCLPASVRAVGDSRARAPTCATSIYRPAASFQLSGGPSSRSCVSARASATSSRQSVAAACCASLEPAATDSVSSASRPAAFASTRVMLPSTPSTASSSRISRAALAPSSPFGLGPSKASAPISPRRRRAAAGSPSGAPPSARLRVAPLPVGCATSSNSSVRVVLGAKAQASSAAFSACSRAADQSRAWRKPLCIAAARR
eukprot:4403722-Pleurochrysis_carterae.AAC.1